MNAETGCTEVDGWQVRLSKQIEYCVPFPATVIFVESTSIENNVQL